MIKSRRMISERHVAGMEEEEEEDAYRLLVEKPEGKDNQQAEGCITSRWNRLRIGTSGGLL
jgi:hypothetical protein